LATTACSTAIRPPRNLLRGTGDRRRWEITILPGEDAQAMTAPTRVWPLLERWITPEDAELERAAAYTFHSVVASCWRDGPLLIVGDSAHQTPPFLGQGMCAGIRDAATSGPHPQRRDGHRAGLHGAIKPSLGPGLGAGWTDFARQLAPQPRLADGTRLDDHVGYRYTALLRPAFAAALPSALLDRLAAADVALVADDSPELQDWLRTVDAQAVLMRPDHYVLGAARTPQEMEALDRGRSDRPRSRAGRPPADGGHDGTALTRYAAIYPAWRAAGASG
jgi:3-(3-hydroxy-phenyl)propionate hydroxylase